MLRIMNMMNEIKVIDSIRSGESEKYRVLVERYQVGLIIHCENILTSRQDAEDVAQDAFVKAFRQLESFDTQKARYSTWLYRIATNLCIDHIRKNKRQVDVADIESIAGTTMPTHIEDEEKRHIQDAIATLEPPKYQDIIKSFFWQGASYQELAERYNTTSGTIGTWMKRAKVQLREKLS